MKKDINDYVNMLIQSTKTQCIVEALKLKCFDFIDKNVSIEDMANKLNLDMDRFKKLLDALVFLDLLYYENEYFSLSSTARKYFLTKSSYYVGDMFIKRHTIIGQNNELLAQILTQNQSSINKTEEISSLATNKNLDTNNQEKLWAKASSNYLKQEQILRKDFALKTLLGLKKIPKYGKILDLGCSTGLTIVDITKQMPNVKLVLFDFEEVIKVAKENIKNHEYTSNISTRSGNINEDDIGENYDLIWCSHVMYFLKNKKDVLRKIYKALNPNGIFVSYHTEIDKMNKKCEDNFFYFLYLSLQNRQMFKPLELVNDLEEVGFKSITSLENQHDLLFPSQITIARK